MTAAPDRTAAPRRTPAQREEGAAAVIAGESITVVARRYGVTPAAVYQWMKRARAASGEDGAAGAKPPSRSAGRGARTAGKIRPSAIDRPSPLRRFTEVRPLDPAAVRGIDPEHPALALSRTLFPDSVVPAAPDQLVLLSGAHQRKLGDRIVKGEWAGFPIFHLSLEERATCPRSCHHWTSCYGNGMPFARRHLPGPELEAAIERELTALSARHPQGFAVRLHTLGDFYSLEYVTRWVWWLLRFRPLRVFSFTAWPAGTPIGDALRDIVPRFWDRFAIRFSARSAGPGRAVTIDRLPDAPKVAEGIVCPAQTGATECCGSCGLCWSPAARDETIVFVLHGQKVGPRAQPTPATASLDATATAEGGDPGPAMSAPELLPAIAEAAPGATAESSETAKPESEPPMAADDADRAGWLAAERGVKFRSNPHPPGSDARRAWYRGWSRFDIARGAAPASAHTDVPEPGTDGRDNIPSVDQQKGEAALEAPDGDSGKAAAVETIDGGTFAPPDAESPAAEPPPVDAPLASEDAAALDALDGAPGDEDDENDAMEGGPLDGEPMSSESAVADMDEDVGEKPARRRHAEPARPTGAARAEELRQIEEAVRAGKVMRIPPQTVLGAVIIRDVAHAAEELTRLGRRVKKINPHTWMLNGRLVKPEDIQQAARFALRMEQVDRAKGKVA